MRASQLVWNGPRIESHNCDDRLPILCQGPVFANWDDILDTLQMLDKVIRFMPGMDQMPQMCPFLREIISSLKPIQNLPDMDQILDMMFDSSLIAPSMPSSDSLIPSSSSSEAMSNSQSDDTGRSSAATKDGSPTDNKRQLGSSMAKDLNRNGQSREILAILPKKNQPINPNVNKDDILPIAKLGPKPMPSPLKRENSGLPLRPSTPLPKNQIIASGLNHRQSGANPKQNSTRGHEGIVEAIEGPIRDILSIQLGPQFASQITSQLASILAGLLNPNTRPHSPIIPSSLLSSLIPSSMPIPLPIHLSEHSKPLIIGSIDSLRIVKAVSMPPASACSSLSLELGSYSDSNMMLISEWTEKNKSMATFIEKSGNTHTILPNGSIYHRLLRLSKHSFENVVCQVVGSPQQPIDGTIASF